MAFVENEGARLRYQRVGTGPPVMLIQGVGVGLHGWQPQIEGLADRFTLISFDNRGIGGSTCKPGPLSIAAMARDALAVLDAEGITDAHIAGHSMGGTIAQEIALTAPERVRSLALLCTFARGAQATALTATLLWTGLRTRIGSRAMRRNAFLELVMPASALASANRVEMARALGDLFGHDLADQAPITMAQLRATRAHDRLAELARLAAIPTLVVLAEHDRIARARFGRMLAAAIPGASLVELPDAGHGVPIHQPARINELLSAHWNRVP